MHGRRRARPYTVGVLVFDDVKLLDFAGPTEVFVESNLTEGDYEIVLVSPDGRPVRTSIGASIMVQGRAADAPPFDTVLIPGSELPPPRFVTPEVLEAASALARSARRVTSVCSGAFILAELGRLDGRRATTHWKFADDLARRFPAVRVEPDSIFVRDGAVYTSAGVAAGIDLALALVEEDHGGEVARRVAQSMLVYMQRAGGQSQFSAALQGPVPRGPLVRALTDLVRAEPHRQWTVGEMAAQVAVSPRHLSRLFRDETESSPAQYLARIRFDLAKASLDAGTTVAQAATAAGYGTAESLRRAFVARLGISPMKYQRRFRSTTPSSGGTMSEGVATSGSSEDAGVLSPVS